MIKWMLCAGGVALLAITTGGARAVGEGESVAVVFNKNLPASKQLAEYYAGKRGVPASHLFGADVNAASEVMSRADFRDKLQNPLFDWLVKEKLFTRNPKKKTPQDTAYQPLLDSKIRYVVLCYGVPLKIARDPALKEEGADKLPVQLRAVNEAAVDADLALLPVSQEKIALTGPLGNPFYLVTNAASLCATNGLLMVARLDGPTVDIARGLVDKALQAESNGLWGRAYIDARGMTNGELKIGDDWMHSSAVITRRMGFETVLDNQEPTFSTNFPMSQIAFYAGWYDVNASGPFARPAVEFMPGAFAYHLVSYSANTLRSTSQNWVGPLLTKGATITMGCVDEPFITGTPNVAAFLDRLVVRRWSFGEAAYACQGSLSWQTTVVGDPLYAPFAQPPDALHFKLERENNPLVEWSHARVLGLNQATGLGVDELIKYIEDVPAVATNSAVLQEKLGSLLQSKQNLAAACEAYGRAVKLKPSPQQKIRLLLTIGELQTQLGNEKDALAAYKQLAADAPDYSGLASVYRELVRLAWKLHLIDDAVTFEKEARRLGAAPK